MNYNSTKTLILYNRNNHRLYLNRVERQAFIDACNKQPTHIRCFCLTLFYTGCRLSELRNLQVHCLILGEQRIAMQSLKKRGQHHIREIPIPLSLAQSLSQLAEEKLDTPSQMSSYLWASERGEVVDRITAYRWVKSVMQSAGITGPHACPKGLRHSFGIHAIQSRVPLNMLQKWMGHADIRTTAIYTNAMGPEEIEIAKRMW